MSIVVEKPGILTTLQDLGRDGYRRFGINPGGVMDRAAARLINILLGNNETEAVIEMHFPTPQLRFEHKAIVAIGGADFAPVVDDVEVPNWTPLTIGKGSLLRSGTKRSGSRAYLAVRGGLKVGDWLGSKSTNLAAKVGGYEGRALAAGDRLKLTTTTLKAQHLQAVRVARSLIPRYSLFPTVRIIAGAEYELLVPSSRKLLIEQDFSISGNSNRMGFRLAAEPLVLAKPIELLSSAVSFGTIQLLPDGQLIVLMADHQSTGGYPRIAHIISYDLPLIAQLGPGDKVGFHLVDIAEAEALAANFERDLSFFRVGCRFQANLWTT